MYEHIVHVFSLASFTLSNSFGLWVHSECLRGLEPHVAERNSTATIPISPSNEAPLSTQDSHYKVLKLKLSPRFKHMGLYV